MLYCKVENNVISNPEPLPMNYSNISNFYLMDETIVNSYGFYRYLATEKPIYNSNSHKIIENLVLDNSLVSSIYSIVPLEQSEMVQNLANMKILFVSIVDQFLDSTVQAKDYKNILHACSYVESTVQQYKNEALTVISWRDSVWQKAYQIQNEILAGQRPVPTEQEFVAELPQMEWPE